MVAQWRRAVVRYVHRQEHDIRHSEPYAAVFAGCDALKSGLPFNCTIDGYPCVCVK